MKIPISIMVASIMSVGTLGAYMNSGYKNEMSTSYGASNEMGYGKKTESYSAPAASSYGASKDMGYGKKAESYSAPAVSSYGSVISNDY